MRCTMVNIPRLISILLLSCFISFSAYGEIKKEYIAKGLVIASCNTLESMAKIAALDKSSEVKAKHLFTSFMKEQKCGVHMPPVVVRLEKLEYEYTDTQGKSIQVWKIFQNNLWALIEEGRVYRIKPKLVKV